MKRESFPMRPYFPYRIGKFVQTTDVDEGWYTIVCENCLSSYTIQSPNYMAGGESYLYSRLGNIFIAMHAQTLSAETDVSREIKSLLARAPSLLTYHETLFFRDVNTKCPLCDGTMLLLKGNAGSTICYTLQPIESYLEFYQKEEFRLPQREDEENRSFPYALDLAFFDLPDHFFCNTCRSWYELRPGASDQNLDFLFSEFGNILIELPKDWRTNTEVFQEIDLLLREGGEVFSLYRFTDDWQHPCPFCVNGHIQEYLGGPPRGYVHRICERYINQ